MAFVTIPGWPIMFPSGCGQGGSFTFTSRTLDASTEKVAWIIRVPRTGTLNKFGFRLGTVTQAPTNGLRISIQDVAADGTPDGTADQFRVVASGSITTGAFITTGLLTSDGTDSGVKRSVVQGQLIAIVIEFSSFASGDSLVIEVSHFGPWNQFSRQEVPYSLHFVSSSWGSREGNTSVLAVQYSDEVWEPIMGASPVKTPLISGFAAASNPDERGMKFTCPVQIRVCGFWCYGLIAGTTSTHKFHLYTGGGTELATATQDPDAVPAPNSVMMIYRYFDDATNVDLAEDGVYRVTLEATGANSVSMYGYIPDSVSFATATQWGEDAVSTSRQNAGAWADATDGSLYAIGLLVRAIDPLKVDLPRFHDLTAHTEAESRTALVPAE